MSTPDPGLEHAGVEDSQEDRFRRIWEVVAAIPPGCVLSYGEVARLAGLPGRARLVGRALGRAPRSLEIPWFRVVNAQGRISFAADSSTGRKQRKLLRAEGVEFQGGRIDLEAHAPSVVLDRLLWGPEQGGL